MCSCLHSSKRLARKARQEFARRHNNRERQPRACCHVHHARDRAAIGTRPSSPVLCTAPPTSVALVARASDRTTLAHRVAHRSLEVLICIDGWVACRRDLAICGSQAAVWVQNNVLVHWHYHIQAVCATAMR